MKAANLVHAAGGSASGMSERLGDDTFAVALQASKEDLERLEEKLKKFATPFHVQRESDGPYAGQIMAIGIQPCDRLTVKRLVSSFGLVR